MLAGFTGMSDSSYLKLNLLPSTPNRLIHARHPYCEHSEPGTLIVTGSKMMSRTIRRSCLDAMEETGSMFGWGAPSAPSLSIPRSSIYS